MYHALECNHTSNSRKICPVALSLRIIIITTKYALLGSDTPFRARCWSFLVCKGGTGAAMSDREYIQQPRDAKVDGASS